MKISILVEGADSILNPSKLQINKLESIFAEIVGQMNVAFEEKSIAMDGELDKRISFVVFA
jgi:hypothetical protein